MIVHSAYDFRAGTARPDTTEKDPAMTQPKYPHIEVQLTGEDGNAFAIMGAVQKALRNAGVPKEDIDAYLAESQSGDYDHLLQTAMATVTVS